MQFQEEVDWMKVLETALRESEKMVLPLAIFKVKIVFIKNLLFVLLYDNELFFCINQLCKLLIHFPNTIID